MITVQIQDTKMKTGGLASSLGYAVDTIKEEDISRFVDGGKVCAKEFDEKKDKPEDMKPFVSSGAIKGFGLRSFIDLDRGSGTYKVASTGDASYGYFFKLDTVNGDGDGVPSTTFGSGSTEGKKDDPNNDTSDKDKMFIDDIFATGKIDSLTFNVGSFTMDTYQASFDGSSKNKGTDKKSELGDKYEITTESQTKYKERKTYDNKNFDWKYENETTFTKYKQEGTRTTDREMKDQVDALVAQTAQEMSASLVSQPLSGKYETTRDNMKVTETVREIGTAGATAARNYSYVSDAIEKTEGSNDTFSYNRTLNIHSTKTVEGARSRPCR